MEAVVNANALQPLSADQVDSYIRQGFLTLAQCCEATELRQIGTILRALFQRRAGRDEGNQFDMLSLDADDQDAMQPQIINPGVYAPALLKTAYFRRIQAIARQLLGPDAQFSFDHSILKPANRAVATPWHQDEAHHQDALFHREQISFWLPLQDVSEDNGCMRYLPGSQLGPLLPHRSLDDDPRIHAIECPPQYFDESAASAQPLAAGGCILHHGRTLHSALPNRTAVDRLVYVLAFQSTPVLRRDAISFDWLAGKRSANLERGLRWHSRGGRWVLLLRRLRRLLKGGLRALPARLRLRYRLYRNRALRIP